VDLSVLIVNWNTREELRACLAALRSADLAMSHEVIVVDNASADGSVEMVRAEFTEVRLIANDRNVNYAAGSNQGLREASGSLILLLNPDTEVPAGAIDTLVADLEENPEWAAVAPALVHPDGSIQESVRGFPTPEALTGEITGLARLRPGSKWAGYFTANLPPDRPSLVDQPMTSALLLRREAFDQIGPFDEQFPLFFNDVDLCYRLKQAGWQIAYDPRVRVKHEGGASTRQIRAEAIRKSHEGLARFYEKHYRGRINPVLFAFIKAMIAVSGRLRAALAGS
jgi:GT2 family glycosyltransferase